ncbi:uncharacterized protein LOC143340829 isoform X2 [Colletes latitarsis]|uniref:uncharacterized protein LOC143340829 isoform X2 n=1 Tax=Colletes latitarsis TaxID=2605962 RepID=UPI004035755A
MTWILSCIIMMGFILSIVLCSTLILSDVEVILGLNIVAGYVPGISGIPRINKTNCLNYEILKDRSLSDALECARTCRKGDPPKTCYYHFVIERYPVSGEACQYCNPNFTNTMCADCQCIIANGVERMGLSVNRMIPGPSIQACLRDQIVIDVSNNIQSAAITIHWHGVFQRGTQYNDGVPSVSQCPIQPGTTFRYNYYANNPGTHFWHAHTGLHKMDGVFGSLIFRQPEEYDPNSWLYDFDLANHVIVINDWMNEEATERSPGRNTGATRQLPDAVIINGKGQSQYANGSMTSNNVSVITVDPGKRYRFRLVNSFCSTCPGEFSIEGHTLTAIATDGESFKPKVVNSIISLPGERYDFVLHSNLPPGSYWIQLRALGDCTNSSIQSLAILKYTGISVKPLSAPPSYNRIFTGVTLNAVQSSCNLLNPTQLCINALQNAKPVHGAIKRKPDLQFYLPIGLLRYSPQDIFRPNTYNNFQVPVPYVPSAALVDGISYMPAPSPPISQMQDLPPDQFCDSHNLPSRCRRNNTCACTHMLRVPLNSVVEIVMVDSFNVSNLEHPFHLHGYAFNVVAMGQPLGPIINGTNGANLLTVDYVKRLDANNQIQRNLIDPPAKDTIAVPNNGYVILRFHATNPGYWFYHCHFVYHQMAGMELIIHVGEQSDLPPVPTNFPKCGNFKQTVHQPV